MTYIKWIYFMASYLRHATTNGISPSVWAVITEHLRPCCLWITILLFTVPVVEQSKIQVKADSGRGKTCTPLCDGWEKQTRKSFKHVPYSCPKRFPDALLPVPTTMEQEVDAKIHITAGSRLELLPVRQLHLYFICLSH